jgi:hypothetical protein
MTAENFSELEIDMTKLIKAKAFRLTGMLTDASNINKSITK